MADNTPLVANASVKVATDEAAYSGENAQFQINRLVHVSGSEGAKTVTEVVTAAGSPAAVALTVQLPGVSKYRVVLLGTTNAVRINSGATLVKGVYGFTKRATPFYVKLHDSNVNPPVAGTTTVDLLFGFQAGIPNYIPLPDAGVPFASGLGITVTAGIDDADTDAVDAEDGVVMVFYVDL